MGNLGFEILSLDHCLFVPAAGLPVPGLPVPGLPADLLWGSESRGVGHVTKHILAFNTESILSISKGGGKGEVGHGAVERRRMSLKKNTFGGLLEAQVVKPPTLVHSS